MGQLLDWYRMVLESLDGEVDNDGLIYIRRDGEREPFASGKKQIYLPTEAVLRNVDWNTAYAFHPANESVSGKQSEVIRHLTALCNLKLYNTSIEVINSISKFCYMAYTNNKLEKEFTEKRAHMDIRYAIPKFTTSTPKAITKIIGDLSEFSMPKPYIMLKLEKDKSVEGVKYLRTCSVISCLFSTIDKLKGKLPESALLSAEGILAMPLNPNATVKLNRGSVVLTIGSNYSKCPYLVALLTTYAQIASKLNTIIEDLGMYKGDCKPIDLSWVHVLDSDVLERWVKAELNSAYPGNYPNGDEVESVATVNDQIATNDNQNNNGEVIIKPAAMPEFKPLSADIFELARGKPPISQPVTQQPVQQTHVASPQIVQHQPQPIHNNHQVQQPIQQNRHIAGGVNQQPMQQNGRLLPSSNCRCVMEVINYHPQTGAPMRDVQGNIFSSFVNEYNQPVEVKVVMAIDNNSGRQIRTFYNELGHPIRVEEAIINNQQPINGMSHNNQLYTGNVPNNASSMAALMRTTSAANTNNNNNLQTNAYGTPTNPWNNNDTVGGVSVLI